jgi:dihydrofolate reductase
MISRDFAISYTSSMSWHRSYELLDAIHYGSWKLPFNKTWVFSKKTFSGLTYWRKPFDLDELSYCKVMVVEGKWK